MADHLNRTSRRQVLKLSAAAAIGAGLGPGLFVDLIPAARADRALRWGSATPGASGYIIIEALASTVSRYSDVRGSAISTGGASENMALLGSKEIDLGQTTSWDWKPAAEGTPPYPGPVEARQMCAYAIWSFNPIVLASSDIETFEDLRGRRVSPGPAGGVTNFIWDSLFDKAGLKDSIRWSYAGWSEVYDALKAGAIDCTGTVLVAGSPGGALVELSTTQELRVIEVPEALIEAVRAENPGGLAFTVTPDMWDAVKKPTKMISAAGILGAVPEVTHEQAYTIIKTIYDNAEEIRRISPVLRLIDIEFATQYLMPEFLVNAGAAQYYKEQGVWRSELQEA